jgi:dethiobiotin synthetase
MNGVFVTGTDTGVGKTLACCALLHALRARGIAATPMKPIAAGSDERDGKGSNEDTRALAAAAGLGAGHWPAITPVLLREPMAPHIAARREGIAIDLARVRSAWAAVSRGAGYAIVEGVGGFKVPLGDDIDTVDLARLFALPVVLVVGMRLGCLNHALLTADAIAQAGLPLAGWIATRLDPRMAAVEENIAALESRLQAPRLGTLPFEPAPDARRLARHLDPGRLPGLPR